MIQLNTSVSGVVMMSMSRDLMTMKFIASASLSLSLSNATLSAGVKNSIFNFLVSLSEQCSGMSRGGTMAAPVWISLCVCYVSLFF